MRAFIGILIGPLLAVCACGQVEEAEQATANPADANDDAVGDGTAHEETPAEETPAEETPVDVPADWVRVEAHCGYSFLAPPGVSVRDAMGTDSCVDVWTASGCMQTGDYGGFNGNLDGYVVQPGFAATREDIHGRDATLVTGTLAEQGRIAAAHFPEVGVDGVTLMVWATCEDAAGQQAALTSFRTIIIDR